MLSLHCCTLRCGITDIGILPKNQCCKTPTLITVAERFLHQVERPKTSYVASVQSSARYGFCFTFLSKGDDPFMPRQLRSSTANGGGQGDRMIMFSYGSNLCRGQMARRCPKAEALGRLTLPDWRLVFRGVADCIAAPGAVCYGGLWRITPDCERALDRYEGVARGIYRKQYVRLESRPEDEVLIYCMNSTGIFPPSEDYLASITGGYRDFALPETAYNALADAVKAGWDDKAPTQRELERHRRKGRPTLALPTQVRYIP